MNAAKECFVDIATAEDPAAAVAKLNESRLRKLYEWLEAKGFETGFVGVVKGLIMLEAVERWRGLVKAEEEQKGEGLFS